MKRRLFTRSQKLSPTLILPGEPPDTGNWSERGEAMALPDGHTFTYLHPPEYRRLAQMFEDNRATRAREAQQRKTGSV